ncbi:MAG TPA: SIS domain-containing protein [Planctomycetota bacterium]|nr:SIS domain-containing protein [Planctomycetota bacterium]
MCGIIAVLRRASRRQPPAVERLQALAGEAERAFAPPLDATTLAGAADALGGLDAQLKSVAGLWSLLQHPQLVRDLRARLETMQSALAEFERTLDATSVTEAPDPDVERRNATLVRLKDALWAVLRDRLPHADGVRELAGGDLPHTAAAAAFSSLQSALSALDRLEVRGRDSAGLSVIVSGIDVDDGELRALLAGRSDDPLFQSGSVRRADGCLDFVYKHAAEIGELGDNVRALRASMRGDALLQAALRRPGVEVLVLGHTRWASVGIISEPNAHPLNQEETADPGAGGPHVIGALNGDVDNHHELVRRHGLHFHDAITTDAKVIPALVSRELRLGSEFGDAFRRTVASFEGSVAIGAATTRDPHRLALSLRGSGQALYVGLAEDTFVVASEPYGVIEECERYLRMDGETPGTEANGSRGQVVVLDRQHAGEMEGIGRFAFDGTPLPVQAHQLARAAVTTRDIDRGAFRHFLQKEIGEAPGSLQKTLRGRVVRQGKRLRTVLLPSALPDVAVQALQQGRTRRIHVIGQGTAAVAGQAVAAAIANALAATDIAVQAMPATELSGFGMRDDMSDTLIVAISQSGTTTDTNRTVDLIRARGAVVIAIVNRRGSDLTDKADGVLYTSDGRDVEMSVASTKAFYAQCAAGQLLALALARAAGCADDDAEHELLDALLALPGAMRAVLAQDAAIAAIARAHAPSRRYWALVGNGRNRIAAAEVRIKLSELCYKSIACDATEDKKHIDLSCEPLILVCAAGLGGSTADDVAKEVAIYKAHKACPIVVATAGETRFAAAAATIEVPAVHGSLAYVLSTMAGHLFGYRAALAIDELALPLRRMRGAIEAVFAEGTHGDDMLTRLRPQLQPHWAAFRSDLLAGRYDGTLEARTAARLTSLCNHALGLAPLDVFKIEFGETGTPGVVIDRLTEELTRGIDQLTRPVDAIKHQAKTVTVGISRADEALLMVPLVRALVEAGANRDRLGYRDLRALAGLDPAVVEVLGSTRYRIEGDIDAGSARIHVTDQRGIAAGLRSRTNQNPVLKGTKHLVAMERQCLVAKGRSDERTVVLVPEVEQNQTVGMTLLHVRFRAHLDAEVLRRVLGGYRNRYAALADAVTETEPSFDESLLASMPVVDLLCEPIYTLADRWRQGTLHRA